MYLIYLCSIIILLLVYGHNLWLVGSVRSHVLVLLQLIRIIMVIKIIIISIKVHHVQLHTRCCVFVRLGQAYIANSALDSQELSLLYTTVQNLHNT